MARAGPAGAAMSALVRGRVLGPAVLVGVIAGAAIWFFGAGPWWGFTIGMVAAALVAVWRAAPSLEEPIWPKHRPEPADGSRDDVHVLGWAVADLHGHVQQRAFHRVREVARNRLAQRGLDLDAASDRSEIEALIGKRAYATLHANVSSMPSQSAVLACLDALDGITA
ncbi:hypothetical protein [Gryllotalpicola protaetiae]|uniref:Uncharacterized protein n=1 Tax=Gryllotalpicola protaetiae TaxID=2419771 RepID=A0A387BUX4_9MICO|nr:hypothetical protein [Gryllotalpicola protaetiae]AYG04886.1 hypothetical protein D7I44_16030 [Gryllotalpicola protaetiae]